MGNQSILKGLIWKDSKMQRRDKKSLSMSTKQVNLPVSQNNEDAVLVFVI